MPVALFKHPKLYIVNVTRLLAPHSLYNASNLCCVYWIQTHERRAIVERVIDTNGSSNESCLLANGKKEVLMVSNF